MSCVTPAKARKCCSQYLVARISPFFFYLIVSEELKDLWNVGGHNSYSHGPPQLQLPIAAGKVSSVYETINYTYLI